MSVCLMSMPELLSGLLVAVAANVASYYICKWLDSQSFITGKMTEHPDYWW